MTAHFMELKIPLTAPLRGISRSDERGTTHSPHRNAQKNKVQLIKNKFQLFFAKVSTASVSIRIRQCRLATARLTVLEARHNGLLCYGILGHIGSFDLIQHKHMDELQTFILNPEQMHTFLCVHTATVSIYKDLYS